MFLGNIALAFAAKRAAPNASLGALILAALLPDLIRTALLIPGIERVSFDSGGTAMSPIGFVSCPYSHSLLLVLVWAGLAAAVHQMRTRYRAGSIAVAALVVANWGLDWVVHVPDLPLLPGIGPKVGLGLGNVPSAAIPLEAALFFVGLMLYLDQTRPVRWPGRFGLLGMIAFACFLFVGASSGIAPSGRRVLVATSLATFACVPWGAWVDRSRRIPRWT
ncbi:MAG: hypothetical protein ACM3JJ_13150 [Hyphomicrobiales bacterium]